MIDDNSKEIFSWLLERAKAQIKIFTMIIEDITCNFYGDMQQGENQKICMNNLVTSGIFYTRKIPNN